MDFAQFWSENEYRTCPFWSGIGYMFRFSSFNSSNDDIISAICKHVMLRLVTTSRYENGYGTQFLVWNRVRIWRTGRHTPTKNSQEYNPPPDRKKNLATSNISNPSFAILCTGLLPFPLRCCITERLPEKRETQQIFKAFRKGHSRIFPTRHAVKSSYCLNHHIYTLCGLTVFKKHRHK